MTQGRTPTWVTPPRIHWKWDSQTPASYRNHFWEKVLGVPMRRDSFLALQSARNNYVLRKNEVAERVRGYPSFVDRDSSREINTKYLDGRNCFKFLLQHGGAYEIPMVNRPSNTFIVRIPAVLDWLTNPVHAPIDPTVSGVVQYITVHAGDWSFNPGYKGSQLPLKAYVYARVAEYLDFPEFDNGEVTTDAMRDALPTIEFSELAPFKNEDVVGDMRGFRIEGSITGEELTVNNRLSVETTLQSIAINIASASTDRKSTNSIDFADASDGGDCIWSFDIEDGVSADTTRLSFEYTLKPRVNM